MSDLFKIGAAVRHARRGSGVIRNIAYPCLPGRPAKYDVRFQSNPTAPCWCWPEDLTVAPAVPPGERPSLRVVDHQPSAA